MSGSGSFAVSRSYGGEDRFYKPPMRKHSKVVVLQPQQQQPLRAVKSDSAEQQAVSLPETAESIDSVMVLSQPQQPVCSSSSTKKPPLTNLDSFLESVTPSVPVRHLFSEAKEMDRRTREPELCSFYNLGELFDTFGEWSAYGVGVQLLLNGEETIKQYYVPFLSGMQLYVDPVKHRQLVRQFNQDSDPDSSMETSRGSSVYLPDKRLKSLADGLANQHNHVKNSELLIRHTRSAKSSSSDEAEIGNSPGKLLFEYFELEQPHNRRPIIDKISALASQFPELRKCRSCDLLPSSWISVAWYPIYRIPMGSTLRDLDASFLTFHNLSTHSRCKSQMQMNGVRNGLGSVDLNSKISLPVFGLATYKLKGSILTPCGTLESDKENSLLQAAERWLQQLEVVLPDFQFFRTQYSRLK